MVRILCLFFVFIALTSCNNIEVESDKVIIKKIPVDKSYQDSLITVYHKNCALNYNYRYQMSHTGRNYEVTN